MKNYFPVLAIILASFCLALTLFWSGEARENQSLQQEIKIIREEKDLAIEHLIKAHVELDAVALHR
ncbi:MAG: hypothetical protein Q8P45_03340 [Candidatus Harrisonbacteria bacterium]|nr:hypothetical protein [Candidatus Harrisonbacteria bacterium]